MATLTATVRRGLRTGLDRGIILMAVALGRVGATLPGVAGPLCISYGAWLAWRPLGWAALGAFCLLLDRRIP